MASRGTVAPKERINITYKPATGDAQAQVELPLKLMVLGDYTLQEDERPLEDRQPVNVDKDNFAEVMRKHELNLSIQVKECLSGEEDGEMVAHLRFDTLKDFSPERIARQIPELNQMLELREAPSFLKGPLGNVPAFRKRIDALLGDDGAREKLISELKGEE